MKNVEKLVVLFLFVVCFSVSFGILYKQGQRIDELTNKVDRLVTIVCEITDCSEQFETLQIDTLKFMTQP